MSAHPKFKYPIDVEKRTYLHLIAYDYESPSAERRKHTSLNTSAVAPITAKKRDRLFEVSTYIPSSFGDKISADWGKGSVAFIDASAQTLLNATINDADTNTKAGLEVGARLLQKFLLDKTISVLDASGFRDTIESFTQRRLAPNETLLFKGTGHRNLTLSLKMTPKNKEESIQIVNIVDWMRKASTVQFEQVANSRFGRAAGALSRSLTNQLGANSNQASRDTVNKVTKFLSGNIGNLFVLFKYPPIFDLRIVRPTLQTARSGSFVEYKSMALLDFDVKYSEDSNVFEYFKDGTPVSTTLNLTFKSLYPAFRDTATFSNSDYTEEKEEQVGL